MKYPNISLSVVSRLTSFTTANSFTMAMYVAQGKSANFFGLLTTLFTCHRNYK